MTLASAIDDVLLRRCTTLAHLKQLHSHLVTSSRFQFCPSRARLLDHIALSGHLSYALLLFRDILVPSTNDYNSILRGLASGPHPSAASSWLRSMLRASAKPDALSCSFALKACARGLASHETLQIHAQVALRGFDADALLGTTLLDAYSKIGDLSSARRVFDEMPVRDIASWNALISGLAHGSRAGEALDLFKKMRAQDPLAPNEITVLGALAACAHLGAFKEGEKIHEYIKASNFDGNVIVCNAIIDMYAKCGFVDKAYGVFHEMAGRKSVVTWNAMIMGFAMHGEEHEALEIFDRMSGTGGVNPDAVSYLAALCACNHAGMVERGVKLFHSMSDRGIEPNMKHYGSVVDLLGRGGRLKEAYGVISSMPVVPDLVLWQSLLGSAQLHNNVEMAEIASRKLVEMGSNSCGDFVLLSNIYAAHERWNDVGRVRDAMKKRDVRKVPGFSYIEVGGMFHKFYNGDKSHKKSREIYMKLEEIAFKIRQLGYVAETNFVFHDIGEEERERLVFSQREVGCGTRIDMYRRKGTDPGDQESEDLRRLPHRVQACIEDL